MVQVIISSSFTRLGLHDQNWVKVISMKVLKSKTELSLRRLLKPSSHASQIIGSFIEIAIVQIVLLLEY